MINCYVHDQHTGAHIKNFTFPAMPRKDEYIEVNNKLYVITGVRYLLRENTFISTPLIYVKELDVKNIK